MAVLARIVYVAWSLSSTPILRQPLADSLVYVDWARELARGSGDRWTDAFYRAPLYPVLVSLFYRIHPRPEQAIVLFQAMLGIGVAAGTARIAWRLHGARAGAFAGALVALYGPAASLDTKLLPTTLGLFISVIALDRILFAGSSRARVLAGLCTGVLALVRPSAVALGAAVALLGVLVPRRPIGAAVRAWMPFVAGMAAAVAPATIHNLRAGEPILIAANGGMTFYHGNNETSVDGLLEPGPRVGLLGNALEQDRIDREAASREIGRPVGAAGSSAHWFRAGWSFLIANPARWAALWGEKLIRSLGTHEYADNYSFQVEQSQSPALRLLPVVFPFLLVPAVAGLLLRPPRGREEWTLVLFAVSGIVTCIVFYVGFRYRCESVPALAILAARGLLSFPDAPPIRRRAALLTAVVLLGVAVLPAGRAGATQDALAAAQWGGAWERDGKADRAVPLYRWAARRDPTLDASWGRWAELTDHAATDPAALRDAVAILDQGIAAGADGKPLRAARGRRLIALGRYTEALVDLRIAHAWAPEDLDVALNLAALLVRAGDADGEALRLLDVPARNGDPLACFYRGIVLLRRSSPADAADDLARAATGMGGDPRPAMLRGLALARMGRAREAAELIDPDPSVALAVIRFLGGEVTEARSVPERLQTAVQSARSLLGARAGAPAGASSN